MTQHTPRSLLLLLAALALAALGGCAQVTAPPPEPRPATWQLSQQAATTFYYLAYEDALRHKRTADALTALDELLKLAPSPTIYAEAAELNWREKRMGKARALLKEGLEAYPDSRELAVTLANTYYSEKRHDDAAAVMRDYLKRVPDDTTVHQDLALIYLDAKRYAEALDALGAIPEDQRTPMILYYEAKASSGLGLNHQAIAKLEAAVDRDPEFVEAWAELAYLHEVDKDYVAAEKVYTKLVEMGETATEVWLRLVNLNIKLNNPDKALALYRQGPSDLDFALEAATLFLDEKFFDQARAVLAPLPSGEDAPPRIWFYRALLAYEGDQDAARAIEYLEKVPVDDPHFHRAVRFRIHLLIDAERQDEARALIRTQQKAFPDEPDYWLLESSLAQNLGELPEARRILEQAVDKWPEDTELLYALGVILDKMNLRDQGIAVMERIITLDPEHADALNYVGYLLADNMRDLDRAQVLIAKALEVEPDNGYIIDSLAWLHFRRGRLDQAWEEIRRAVERVADDPTIWEHYGDIAKALGKADKAAEGYRNSLEVNPENQSAQDKLDSL
ncbi:tetratricopeptide repeat protein [Desulfocurvus sp. DL9XJH121]